MQPKVSVIIPVYNTQQYVEEAVRSIMNQTLEDIEIIVVDDCSTDDSPIIVNTLAQQENRIIVLRNTINSGQSVARNVGLSKASGKYIMFFDSDDILDCHCLEKCYDKAIALNLDIVMFDAVPFYQGDIKNKSFTPKYSRTKYITDEAMTGIDCVALLQKNKAFSASVCLQLFSKDILYGRRFVEHVYYEDELFTLPIYIDAKAVGCVKESFYLRRIRENSQMTTPLDDKRFQDRIFICHKLLDDSLERDGNVRKLYRRQVLRLLIFTTKQILCSKPKVKLRNRISDLLKVFRRVI